MNDGRYKSGVEHSKYRHGMYLSPEYNVWSAMKARCSNPKTPCYKNYGGRGIRVCERWSEFSTFIADMGRRPSSKHTLDRIDNSGNYEPNNCRWATRTTNNRNSRHVRFSSELASEIRRRYSLGGISHSKLAREYGTSKSHIGGIVNNIYWKETTNAPLP